MFIEKSDISANDIVSVKLSNGDEIIAKVLDTNAMTLTVVKPFLMQLVQDRSGQPAITMAPFWILGGGDDSKFKISTAHIVCMLLSGLDAKKGYLQQTSSLLMPGSLNPNGPLANLVT